MSMMRSLAAISVLAVPCCASAAPATCTPGPALHAVVGAPAFHVFDDCIDAEHQWLEIAAALTDSQLPARIAMDRLLRGLDAQVRHAMGRALPAHVQLCVFPAGTTGWKSASVGCIKRGYENEEAEGGRPEDDDDQPQLENHAPFSPVEEVRRLQGLFGSEFGKTRHPTVTADEASHTLKIVYPFVERGTDRWASPSRSSMRRSRSCRWRSGCIRRRRRS